jgi:translocation and assembly module TamA
VSYRQALLFGHPYTLQSGIGLDQTRAVAYADIHLPPKPDGAQDSFGVLTEHTDIENVQTRRWAVGAQRDYTRASGPVTYDTRLALSFQHEARDINRVRESRNDVVAGTYTWTRRNFDSITNPTRGALMSLSGTLGLRSTGLGEVLNDAFVRGYGRYLRYLPLSPRDQLIVRGDLGDVSVEDPGTVPNEFLFRTGGVGTVRGYGYQSLGRKSGTATLGSTSMFSASVEYVRWLSADWGAALFYDVGDAADGFNNLKPAQGYGLGARWRTLAGPLALDLAYGERTGRLRLHFSVALAF